MKVALQTSHTCFRDSQVDLHVRAQRLFVLERLCAQMAAEVPLIWMDAHVSETVKVKVKKSEVYYRPRT